MPLLDVYLPSYVYYLVEVINHTTLQLTCVSQWNSSRYQYNTGLHFNVSESSFITFVDLFHITGRLVDKEGDIRMSKVLKQIKPRSVSISYYSIVNVYALTDSDR